MFKDFIDLIALLNRHKAKYLVIGGYAVGFHAQARATKDLDILILPAPRNAAAVFAALQEFGAPLRTKKDPRDRDRFAERRAITARDFEDKDSWFMMGTPRGDRHPCRDSRRCIQRRVEKPCGRHHR